MFKSPLISVAAFFLFIFFLCFNSFSAFAQVFAKLPASDYDEENYVDLYLPTEKSLGSFPIGKEIWDVKYYKLIDKPRSWRRVEVDDRENKTGVEYKVYEKPFTYYAVLDMPSGERFYGLVTTGYDEMGTILNEPKAEWNPYTKIQPIDGTLVASDGTQSGFFLHSDADWNKLKIAKPIGSYHIQDFRGYERVSFTFNQGGTGIITLVPYVHTQQFITYSGGTLKQKMANGRTKRRTNVILGGPHSWQITAKRNFKWSFNDSGDLIITPTGASTIYPKDWVPDDPDDKTYWSSKADSIFSRRQTEHDHKYLHDEIIEYNKNIKISSKEAADQFKSLTILSPRITKNEIVGVESSDLDSADLRDAGNEGKSCATGIYLGPKTDGEMNLAYITQVYNKVPDLKKAFRENRDFGVDIQYRKWADKTKILVAWNKDIFGDEPSYSVVQPSVKDGHAYIGFFNNGKLFFADLFFDKDGQIDADKFKQSIIVDTTLDNNKDRIAELHSKILEYKKDKQRGKIVKDYEKRFKKTVIPTTATSKSEYFNIGKIQESLIKDQEETLKLLQE